MTITIKFFATFRDLAGTADQSMQIGDGMAVADVIEKLEQQYPKFGGKLDKLALTAVNETYVQRQKELRPNDVVAFFPPVSGG